MSSDFIATTIGELGDVVGGATPSTKKTENWDGEIPWLSPKDLTGYKYRYIGHGARNISKQGYESSSTVLLPAGSILFSSRAPIGYIAVASNPICTNQGFKSVVPNSNVVDGMFLFYLLKHTTPDIQNAGSGTTFKEVSGKVMRDIKVMVPRSIDLQRKIACVLDLLDTKIELNQQTNDYLVELATTLFNEECSQTNEPNSTLTEIADITMGQSPAGSSYNEVGEGEVFYQGRGEFGTMFPRRRLYTTEPKRMAQEGDTLMSVRAPVGDLNIAIERCCVGRGLAAIHSDDFQSFVHYLLRGQARQLDSFNGDGTVFGSINGKALMALPVYLPTRDVMTQLEARLEPIDQMIRKNDDELQALEQLRDALLPKLMSGKIDVSKVDLTQLNNHLSAG